MTDFTVMVEGTSYMFVTGPNVVKRGDPRGGRRGVARRRGRAHRPQRRRASRGAVTRPRRWTTSGACSPTCRRTTSRTRRVVATRDPRDRMDAELDAVVPDEPAKPYDMHDVLRRVVDDGDFLEIQPAWAANILVGFARLGGRAVGIVAQQPAVLAGALDIDASVKAARFVRTCDAFNVPLVTFVDVPGLPARRRAGARRDHPPRREAALRLLRGDGPEGDGHHAQGVRRRVRRHEQQAHPRRHELRVADARRSR